MLQNWRKRKNLISDYNKKQFKVKYFRIEEKAALKKHLRDKKANNEALDNIEAAKEGERYDKLMADDVSNN